MMDPAEYYMNRENRNQTNLQNVMQMIMAVKQWQDRMKQQGVENEQAQQRFGLDTAKYDQGIKEWGEGEPYRKAQVDRENAAARYYNYREQPKPDPDWAQAELLSQKDPTNYPTPDAAFRAIKKIKTPQDELSQFESEQKIRQKYEKPEKPEKTPQWKDPAFRQGKLVENTVKDYDAEMRRLQTVYAKLTKESDKSDVKKRIDNLGAAVSRLRMAQGAMSEGQTLPTKDWDTIKKISSGRERAKEEPEFWDNIGGEVGSVITTAAGPKTPPPPLLKKRKIIRNPKTGERMEWVNGQWQIIQ